MKLQDQIDMARMLQKYELGLAALYEVYRDKFPEHSQFWESIAVDERSHAFLIKTFEAMMEDGELVFSLRPYRVEVIEKYLEDLNGHAHYARRNEMPITEALMVAMEMESRVLEREIFKPLEGDSSELIKMLRRIQEETQGHFNKIKSKYRKEMEGK